MLDATRADSRRNTHVASILHEPSVGGLSTVEHSWSNYHKENRGTYVSPLRLLLNIAF